MCYTSFVEWQYVEWSGAHKKRNSISGSIKILFSTTISNPKQILIVVTIINLKSNHSNDSLTITLTALVTTTNRTQQNILLSTFDCYGLLIKMKRKKCENESNKLLPSLHLKAHEHCCEHIILSPRRILLQKEYSNSISKTCNNNSSTGSSIFHFNCVLRTAFHYFINTRSFLCLFSEEDSLFSLLILPTSLLLFI